MRLLLDSHAFLWALEDNPRLSRTARDAIEGAGNELFLSIASVWELSIKAGLGQLDVEEDLLAFLTEQLRDWRITLMPIALPHAVAVRNLPMHHRDPFDRMLIAQSSLEDAPLVTDDSRLRAYDVSVLW